jgi:hypothetical protein
MSGENNHICMVEAYSMKLNQSGVNHGNNYGKKRNIVVNLKERMREFQDNQDKRKGGVKG